MRNFLGLCLGVMMLAVIALALTAPDDTQNIEQQTQLAQAEAEKARYDAELAQVELDIEQARADLEVAKGERVILESAARSIDSDRELTEYYAHRGDTRAILFVVSVLGLTFCGIVFTYVMNRRYENERHAQTHP